MILLRGHQAIVKFYVYFEDDYNQYIVMVFVSPFVQIRNWLQEDGSSTISNNANSLLREMLKSLSEH